MFFVAGFKARVIYRLHKSGIAFFYSLLDRIRLMINPTKNPKALPSMPVPINNSTILSSGVARVFCKISHTTQTTREKSNPIKLFFAVLINRPIRIAMANPIKKMTRVFSANNSCKIGKYFMKATSSYICIALRFVRNKKQIPLTKLAYYLEEQPRNHNHYVQAIPNDIKF